jgi:hypothetical protein
MLKRVSSLNRVEEDEQREFGPRPRGVLHSPSQAKPQVLLYSRHAHLNCIGCLPCNARKASKSPASAFVIWPATERTIPMATFRVRGPASSLTVWTIASVSLALRGLKTDPAELAHPDPGQAEIDWVEHLSASKEHRMAYPSDWNYVIRDYTGDEAKEETELLLELLDL